MIRRIFLLPFVVLAFASSLEAQQDTTRLPTGVRLGMIYQTLQRPVLAVRPFTAEDGLEWAAEEVGAIVRRDLDYSDRFEIFETPPQLATGPVDYDAWNGLGVVYVVTGAVEALEDGILLRLTLHDVVYGNVRQQQAFAIPPTDSPAFRMAVHAASDEVVRWVTGQPGMAASRIVFRRQNADGSTDLMVVDSDGENVRRLTRSEELIYSPTWSPDGRRVAYTAQHPDGTWDLLELEVESGQVRKLTARPGTTLTPAYSPDGRRIAFGLWTGRSTDLYEYDLETRRLRVLREGPGEDMSPSYSPDGRQIAFMSDRIGQPHIYVMPTDGGEATLISPYTYGEPGYYTSPEWSPESSLVAFHGRSRGQFQIMVADAARPGSTVQQLTSGGVSQDPSWAPDGRHLVFVGVREGGAGLYVIDAASGRTRPLVLDSRVRLPDWSPALLRASALMVSGR